LTTDKVDLNSLEPSYFTLRITTPLTTEEIQKLTDLGGTLQYDNGLMALIVIPPVRLNEFAENIESIIEIR
jgi:hypothetical protein